MQRNEEVKKLMFTFYFAILRLRSKLYRRNLFKERDYVNFSFEENTVWWT